MPAGRIEPKVPIPFLKELFAGPQTFTATDMWQRTLLNRAGIYEWLARLEELGWVERFDRRVTSSGHSEVVWRRTMNLRPLDPPYAPFRPAQPKRRPAVRVRSHRRRG